jgi:hypothetical protein
MSEPLRVAQYLNQFFAGIGGEERADVGVSMRPEPVGPGARSRPRSAMPGASSAPSSAATTTLPSGRRRPSPPSAPSS